MLNKMIVLSKTALLSLVLSACGSATIEINLPGGGNPPESAPAQVDTNTLLIVLVGGILIILVAVLLGRKR